LGLLYKDLINNVENEPVTLSKNICIGLFISGSMAYFDDEDRKTETAINEMEACLEKKLTPFRNGTESFRERAKKTLHKKKKSKKDLEIIKKVKFYNHRFLVHSSIANKAWIKLQDNIKCRKFAINSLIIALLYRVPEVKKYYNFSQNSLFSLSGINLNFPVLEWSNNYSYSSLCVANILLKYLDEEITKYNKKNHQ
jgi:hypothetical protein